jgi:hypothetical protein
MKFRVGLAVLVALVSACGGEAPSMSPVPTSLPTNTPVVSQSSERLFGQILAIDLAGPSVTIDLRQWFGLPEAVAAAREDGFIGPNDDLPEPFYIRDLHERRTLALAKDALVTVLGLGEDRAYTTPMRVTLAEFVAAWRSGPASGAWTPAFCYWFSPSGDAVRSIEAQYVP